MVEWRLLVVVVVVLDWMSLSLDTLEWLSPPALLMLLP